MIARSAKVGFLLIMVAGSLAGQWLPASAQSCTGAQLAEAVDRGGAALRRLTQDTAPRIERGISDLRQRRGYAGPDGEQRAWAEVQDTRASELDQTVSDLLARLSAAGTAAPAETVDCARVAEVEATTLELQAAVRAKSTHLIARLEMLTASAAAPAPKAVAPAPAPKAAATPPPAPVPPPVARAPAPVAPPAPPATTAMRPDASRDVARVETPAPPPPPNLPPPADDPGYTIDEIKAISEGLFGKLTANLAGAIEQLFARSGRPSAYIIGEEGGAAFLAGLRYGKGMLYMRAGGERPIYWHGPSVGLDLGAQGGKTLFLVYKLDDPDQLYARFTGIDGSAFVVGGVGITLIGNGRITLAPIRTGLGLRLGANVGFIRFTPTATLNPF
jgi:hypothetical protein